MQLYSWNVNGLRAALKNGFLDWFSSVQADIVCLQEIKVFQEQLEEDENARKLLHPLGYHHCFHSAQKPGYSGVAIYSKAEPVQIEVGIGDPLYDNEGRVLIAHYPEYILINAYFPNSQRDHARLTYKLGFCKTIMARCEEFRKAGKSVVLCGDYNIAHKEIDLKNPKENETTAGFLPEERAWMDAFVTDRGYIDTFRHFEKGPNHYTWWSYRPGVRKRNIGWRIDYFSVNPEMKDRLKSATIHSDVMGSDHCPVGLLLKK